MAKSVRGGDSFELNNGTSGTVTWPASVGTNDIAYIFASYYKNSGSGTINTPSGFSSLLAETGIDAGGGTGQGTSCIRAFYKECGTESGNLTVSFSSVSVYANIILVVFAGDGDLTHASVGTAQTAQSTTDATAPAVSATNGQLLVGFYGLSDPPGTTNSAPSGMSLAQDADNTTNSARVYWQSITSTASTGDKTWDFQPAANRNVGAFLALADDAGAGGGGTVVNILSGRGGAAAQPIVVM